MLVNYSSCYIEHHVCMVPYTALLILCYHPPRREPIARWLEGGGGGVRLSRSACSFEMTHSMYTIRQS